MDLNFSLHDAQMEIFEDEARIKVVAAGRRFGKSYLSAVMLLIEALKLENQYGYDVTDKEVWYIAPTFQQAKDIMWALLKNLGQDVIESTVENTATLRLINGRKIQLKGSDRPDTLRGVGISFVVLDEYAFMKPNVWEAIIRPTLADVRGGALFIGTPEGKNHFYDLYLQADKHPDWRAFSYHTIDNPTIDSVEILKAGSEMSSDLFRQEFEASFEAGGGSIFQENWIVYDEDEPEEGHFYITVDPAGYEDVRGAATSKINRLDQTAIAIVKVHAGGWWVKEIDAGRWGIRETALRIIRHAKNVRAMEVGIEGGSLKNAIMPYLEDSMRRLNSYIPITTVTHGNRKKTERITWALQGRLEHGRIALNRGNWNKDFISQMLDFPNPLSHDDMLDALAYIDQIAVTTYGTAFEIDEWEPLDDIAGI